MTVDLRCGDNRLSLQRMIDNGEFVDSVVTDPPYGLVSVTKRFGGANAKPAKFGTDGAFSRQSKGFMQAVWDGTGIERDPEFWHLVYQVMKPGAYILAFSSSRTYGYMQVAMEQAGFITHPMFGWTFSTGFPKGHDPKVEGYDGWKTGTQSFKPALEPIYFGQKPFSEKTGALNILKHGVGAVNIEGCRVETNDSIHATRNTALGRMNDDNWTPQSQVYEQQPGGRYPANLVHDGSPEVVALFPDSKGQLAKASDSDTLRAGQRVYGEMLRGSDPPEPRNDDGSAARFFNSFPHEGPLLHYPKANKADRAGSKHATVKPLKLIQHLQRLSTPPGGITLDPFAGSGTSGAAALAEGFRSILMEAELEYCRDIRRRFGMPETVSDKLLAISEALS